MQQGSDFRSRLGAVGRCLPVPLRRFGDNRVSFDFHFDLSPFLQLNQLSVGVGKAVGKREFLDKDDRRLPPRSAPFLAHPKRDEGELPFRLFLGA